MRCPHGRWGGSEGGRRGGPKAFCPSSCPGVSVGTQAGPGVEELEGLGISLPTRRLLQELDSSL